MKKKQLAYLLASSALSLLISAPVMAQDNVQQSNQNSTNDYSLNDIVVTAQRREESLQDVPVAVTALGADAMAQMRVSNIANLSGAAPSLQIQSQGIQSTSLITIRGIASGSSINSVDPKVGMYLDGVYVGRSTGAVFDLADIERIEILRGPQGTLFGRNSTSGAINMITARPTGELGVKQDLSYGNYNALRTRTVLNLPALGPLSVKLSYLHDEMDGDIDNLLGGEILDFSLREPRFGTLRYADKLGERNIDAAQASARLDLGDLTVDYNFDYTDSRSTGRAMQQLGIIPGQSGSIAAGILAYQGLFGGITNLSSTRLNSVAAATSREHVTVSGHNVTMTWNQSDAVTVKSITAWRKMNQRPNVHDLAATGGLRFSEDQFGLLISGDPDNIALIPTLPVTDEDRLYTLLTARSTKQSQFTQELQFQVTQDAFDLVAGAFYFREKSPAIDVLGIFQPVQDGVIIPTDFDPLFGSGVTEVVAENTSMALYGQGTLHLSDTLDISAGLRYTSDTRKTEIITLAAASAEDSQGAGTYKSNYAKFNYSAIITWKPDRDLTAYAKVATGYVAGGIMSGKAYDPESLISYELGVKSSLWNNRLRANAAVYYMKYTDLQTQNFIDGVQSFSNAGKANIKGAELEVDAIPVRGLTLSGSVGYTDFDYKTFILDGEEVADVARPPYFANWTGRLAAQYDLPEFSGGGNPFARIEGRYRSKSYLTSLPIADPAVEELNMVKGYWLVDARAGVAALPIGGTTVNLSAWAKNLLNKDYYSWGTPAITLTATYERRRTYGVDLSLAF